MVESLLPDFKCDTYKNTMKTIEDMNLEYEEDIVFISSTLYNLTNPLKHKFITDLIGLEKSNRIRSIMENVNKMKSERTVLPFCDDMYLSIIADALFETIVYCP